MSYRYGARCAREGGQATPFVRMHSLTPLEPRLALRATQGSAA